MGDAGDGFLSRGIALHKTEPGGPLPEALTDPGIGEGGADEVQLWTPQSQVDGQTGLVLAVAGEGHIFSGERRTVLRQGTLVDACLLFKGPPAAHRDDGPPAIQRPHKGLQRLGGLTVQQHRTASHRNQVREPFWAGVLGVDQN